MKSIIKVGLVVLSLSTCQAWAGAKPADDNAKIRENLSKYFPTLKIDSISPSPLPGLVQVMAGGSVLYISTDGRYAISGDIIDLKNDQANLTDSARKEARVQGLKSLGEDQMIVFPAKDPEICCQRIYRYRLWILS